MVVDLAPPEHQGVMPQAKGDLLSRLHERPVIALWIGRGMLAAIVAPVAYIKASLVQQIDDELLAGGLQVFNCTHDSQP